MASTALRDDAGKLLLRLVVGLLLLLHGVAKLKHGVGWMAGPLAGIGLPTFVAYGAYVGEVLAPLFAVMGKYTRVAGLLIAFNMLMAIVVARRDKIAGLNQGGGWNIELEALFLAGGLLLLLFGSGRYAASAGKGRWD